MSRKHLATIAASRDAINKQAKELHDAGLSAAASSLDRASDNLADAHTVLAAGVPLKGTELPEKAEAEGDKPAAADDAVKAAKTASKPKRKR